MDFKIDYRGHVLQADRIGPLNTSTLFVLHGAGSATRGRFLSLRERLAESNITSTALDFLGHGETGGQMSDSSLASRTEQALALITSQDQKSLISIIGSSMGAYNAIKITEQISVDMLILFVPGIYSPEAYRTPFGKEFSRIIRQDRSWSESDAWEILSKFTGSLLVIESENDKVIPKEIPERLISSATRARRCEHLTVAGAPHQIAKYLSENPKDFDTVVQKILDMYGVANKAFNSD
ncbi:MAG: alpha/beta hydrolase [Amphritea sp.]|nr:alpha/beta hydrolase [Amphritea sp.]